MEAGSTARPGLETHDGADLGTLSPDAREGLESWLLQLKGGIAKRAEEYADLLDVKGVTCLRELTFSQAELEICGIPQAQAKRIAEGAAALFAQQGWYLAPTLGASPLPPAGGAVPESHRSRVRSGQIKALPECPVFADGGVINRAQALSLLQVLIAWAHGWSDTLGPVMIALKEEPEASAAVLLAGRQVDADENKLFSSALVSEWQVALANVETTTVEGGSGLHILHELLQASLLVEVDDASVSLSKFLTPYNGVDDAGNDEFKCTQVTKLYAALKQWRNALTALRAAGALIDGAANRMILNSLERLVRPAAGSKLNAMQESRQYHSWQEYYEELLVFGRLKSKEALKKKPAQPKPNPTPNSAPNPKPRRNPKPQANMVAGAKPNPCNQWMMQGQCEVMLAGGTCRYDHSAGRKGVIDPQFCVPCRSGPCVRKWCPFQHAAGQYQGAGQGGAPPPAAAPLPSQAPGVRPRASGTGHAHGAAPAWRPQLPLDSSKAAHGVNKPVCDVNLGVCSNGSNSPSSSSSSSGSSSLNSPNSPNSSNGPDSSSSPNGSSTSAINKAVVGAVISAVRTALDSAATRDVVSADDLEACLSDVMGAPVAVDTAGGEVKVSRLASKVYEPGLETVDGLSMSGIRYNLLSLVERLKKGWRFEAEGVDAVLSDVLGNTYDFTVEDDLLLHDPNKRIARPQVHVSTRSAAKARAGAGSAGGAGAGGGAGAACWCC